MVRVASIRAIEPRLRNPCASHATPSVRVELSANDTRDARSTIHGQRTIISDLTPGSAPLLSATPISSRALVLLSIRPVRLGAIGCFERLTSTGRLTLLRP